MIHTRPSEPFGARDDIADAERQRKVMKHREEQAERLESEQRAQQEAAARAREDGSPPTVLGRVMIRQFESSMLVELADRLPGVTLRLLLPVGARWDPSSLSGMFKTLGAMLNENIGAVNDPTHRFWQLGVIDVNGGGSTAMPTTVLAVGEPLYRLPAPVAPAEPSDEERARAVELAREAVEVLSPTKARARDLAASLRTAIATGPHAIEALALVLEQRAGIAPTDETEPPRAA